MFGSLSKMSTALPKLFGGRKRATRRKSRKGGQVPGQRMSSRAGTRRKGRKTRK